MGEGTERGGREYPRRPIVGVGAVIVVPGAGTGGDGEGTGWRPAGIVLVRRRFPPLAGEWSIPGGAVEVGETLHAAVAREVLEETALVVDVGPVADVVDRIVLDADGHVHYHYVLVDYVCLAVAGRLSASSDVTDAVVAPPGALDVFGLHESTRAVIARALTLVPDGWRTRQARNPAGLEP